MTRREILRAFALSVLPAKVKGQMRVEPVRHEVQGTGPTLIIGLPITLSSPEPLRAGYLNGLTDTYRVVLMDYPSRHEDASSFTPDRVSDDMLAVADATGADRFAWYGFSWGGVVGLQLAARTNRLTALVCGGWPPLGGPFRETLSATESLATRISEAQPMVTYYRGLQNWPEREVVSKMNIPRMTFAGSNDIVGLPGAGIPIGPVIARQRSELERMGWIVRLVDGFGHELVTRPDLVVPLIRGFLDPVLLSRRFSPRNVSRSDISKTTIRCPPSHLVRSSDHLVGRDYEHRGEPEITGPRHRHRLVRVEHEGVIVDCARQSSVAAGRYQARDDHRRPGRRGWAAARFVEGAVVAQS